ncbi:hypothetical protein NAT51_16415 [Flavobacterium amniphilum]|uniref:hypothetical protein n=1 Tax=Flavobacterium amniphilum TaxID=1834035 RepID=UPI00202AC081|nr:hypothetical protein [Flavobacterium amniphilum]MCL9807121.1 hypothetical protein [Flavobacterium amniphilum]
MGYYTRVFCSSQKKPKISEILENLKSSGFTVGANLDVKNLDNSEWTNFELIYDSERLPLLIELNEIGKSDELAEEEISEFIEFVGEPKFLELKKKKVIKHLKKSNYIICIQLPTSDINDEGYNVNGELMTYIERNFSGMTQADREGFYLNNELLIELE